MYEASEIVTIGEAHSLVQGIKYPLEGSIDSMQWIGYAEPVTDIDEVDE